MDQHVDSSPSVISGARQIRLAGVAEIADLAGLSRQAVTNMRSRDSSFPRPVAELRSGPVFDEDEVQAYLADRGRNVRPKAYDRVRPAKKKRFDPLDRLNLARSVERALLEEDPSPLPPEESFPGAGLYCIYYSGPYEAYASTSKASPEIPLYVGRAIPRGARAGVGGLLSTIEEPVLINRLRQHARSIQQVEQHGIASGEPQLRLNDFWCRYLVVEDIWVPLAEALLIAHFQPVWNQVLQGFGNHDPGGGRRRGARPDWDELHPGRPWAAKQEVRGRAPEESLRRIREHLNKPRTPDFDSLPELTEEILDDSSDGAGMTESDEPW